MIKIPQNIPIWFRHSESEKTYLEYDELIAHTLNKLSAKQCEIMKKIENIPIGIFDIEFTTIGVYEEDFISPSKNSKDTEMTFNEMFKRCDHYIENITKIDLDVILKSSNTSIYKKTKLFTKSELILKNNISDQTSIRYIVGIFFISIKDNYNKRTEWNRLNQQRRYNQWHRYYINLYKKASANG